jgi:LytS/YehU family sensor histidine kinase
MAKLDALIDNKIVQNLFIWFCLFIILLGAIQSENRILSSLFVVSLLAPAIYINNLIVLPFFNKNWFRFSISFILNSLFFASILLYVLLNNTEREFSFVMFLNAYGIIILAIAFGTAVKISRDSFVRRQEEKNAELKLLKAQLNPHFLFNTLNNLYGLAVIKSDKLPDLMLKLSELLRYSLYNTKEVFVDLRREVQYIENYIALEKIRLEEQVEIQTHISGDLRQLRIPPMLLIVFVENAFKHLAILDNKKSLVKIEIELNKTELFFSCLNTVDTMTKKNSKESDKSGIGLKNVKKRLALLYPERHKLMISASEFVYRVELKINL